MPVEGSWFVQMGIISESRLSNCPRLWLAILILLLSSACTASWDSSHKDKLAPIYISSPTASIRDTAAPRKETTVTTAAIYTQGFNCSKVSQIPAAECEALVEFYNSTSGPEWSDSSGWLDSDSPCSWLGITCTDGHVSHMSLPSNQLTGSLPTALGDLPFLRLIELGANRLSGDIPAEMGNLAELASLHLWDNLLSGPLPPELGTLDNLHSLSLAHNQISGSIPCMLGNLISLESLDLSHNEFSGDIPTELGALDNLYALSLSHNQLSGVIPAGFDRLKKLNELDLSYNHLSGSAPDFVANIDQSMLWGNRLEGTITAEEQAPFFVDYMGARFEADPSLAASIWPEVKAATPVADAADGPSYWLAVPEHLRFTFADPDLALARRPMGFNLAAEAQILLLPLAELEQLNPSVQTQVDTLGKLLTEKGAVPDDELPLLPRTNSAQVFHAQALYLDTGNVQGLRFISQHSQDPHPIMLSQELFYTFQGFTADGKYYVAAFFPLSTDVLPEAIAIDNWDAFHADYDKYLTETTTVLDQLHPTEFVPDLNLLDAVITSLHVGQNIHPLNGELTEVSLPLVSPPKGTVYRASDGLWQIDANGDPQLLTSHTDALLSPDAAKAAYMDDQRRLWLLDLAVADQQELAAGYEKSGYFSWGNTSTLLLGVWLHPSEMEGGATGHVATLNIDTNALQVIDNNYLSLGRPALAPDGEKVAYDVSPFYAPGAPTGRVFHPESGGQSLDLISFMELEDEESWHLFNPAWSPDGSQQAWLWTTNSGTYLLIIDHISQAATNVLGWQPAQFGALPPSPIWSTDGKWLAIEVWANNESESGLWLAASDGSEAKRISATTSSFAVGSGPIWFNSHELAYVECDENFSNCTNRLYDLNSDTAMVIDLPPETIVVLGPFNSQPSE